MNNSTGNIKHIRHVMPQFDGFMAGKVLKRNQITKDIPKMT